MSDTEVNDKGVVKGINVKALQPLRVGIIRNEANKEDILEYRDELVRINKELNGKVTLVLFGYTLKDVEENWLKGVEFEFVKPTSIIHYFQQLKALNLDLLFIPLIRSNYNATSENYNKYLEASLFNIPILTLNIYPYNTLIGDKRNGFIFKDKKEFFPYIEHLYTQRALIQMVGASANEDVKNNFDYSVENIEVISELFD
jgi:hypothetical protein